VKVGTLGQLAPCSSFLRFHTHSRQLKHASIHTAITEISMQISFHTQHGSAARKLISDVLLLMLERFGICLLQLCRRRDGEFFGDTEFFCAKGKLVVIPIRSRISFDAFAVCSSVPKITMTTSELLEASAVVCARSTGGGNSKRSGVPDPTPGCR
jgi:hypothetical protein